MRRRAFGNPAAALALFALLGAGASGAASAAPDEAGGKGEVVVCTWGGTPTAATGTVEVKPGLTLTPSDGPLKIVATGRSNAATASPARSLSMA